MNSVFGAYEGDIVWGISVHPNERSLVQSLGTFKTTRRLRAGYAYANLNFEILGQVLEYQTNTTWAQYLDATFFTPLGMVNTYGAVPDVPATGDLSFGHVICNGKVAGPYDLRSSPEIALGYKNGHLAAGSMLSTASDLALFLHASQHWLS
ncbi:beta-lactamase [Saprolegnia diclina VS20]|uniref:Beta-lactamase n=1 Tax=Saprolegnia diclina (strain VS20) TaxID=1156394 RepID=T0Q2D8_SAPDV|nr:beta-lactamase [Saprolegnia diclina VS20]EQC31974.1 beta-lactamase [Saprolegnia diclina VS20]|eukprot:XP_008614702.1 beta-lactamase [Saprolegnia diclina VS20]